VFKFEIIHAKQGATFARFSKLAVELTYMGTKRHILPMNEKTSKNIDLLI
jgi:hypothetical protein